MRITKKQALDFYNKHKNNILLQIYFPTFEDYWRECEKLNNMPEEEYQRKVEEIQNKLKKIKKILKSND